jgi:hypothetical protein
LDLAIICVVLQQKHKQRKKNEYIGLDKMQKLFCMKEHCEQIEMTIHGMKKMFLNHTFDKGLVYINYIKNSCSSTNKTTKPI